jgi:hypothetical protein
MFCDAKLRAQKSKKSKGGLYYLRKFLSVVKVLNIGEQSFCHQEVFKIISLPLLLLPLL